MAALTKSRPRRNKVSNRRWRVGQTTFRHFLFPSSMDSFVVFLPSSLVVLGLICFIVHFLMHVVNRRNVSSSLLFLKIVSPLFLCIHRQKTASAQRRRTNFHHKTPKKNRAPRRALAFSEKRRRSHVSVPGVSRQLFKLYPRTCRDLAFVPTRRCPNEKPKRQPKDSPFLSRALLLACGRQKNAK